MEFSQRFEESFAEIRVFVGHLDLTLPALLQLLAFCLHYRFVPEHLYVLVNVWLVLDRCNVFMIMIRAVILRFLDKISLEPLPFASSTGEGVPSDSSTVAVETLFREFSTFDITH